MLAKTSTLVCVVLGAALSTARADDAPPAAEAADGTYQLTLPKGRALLDAFVEINLSDGAEFKPVSVSPDVWYGVTEDLTVGLVHSVLGTTGVIGSGFGTSLCLTGTSNGCGSIYPNVGADARYKLKPLGAIVWAVEGGLYAVNTDPIALAIKAGAVGRWQKGKLAVEAAPNLFLGVTERDGLGQYNKEILSLPATLVYTVAPKISVAGQVAFVLPIEDLGDLYFVSTAVAGHYDLNESVTLNAAFAFPAVFTGVKDATGKSVGGIDFRTFTLGGTYAF